MAYDPKTGKGLGQFYDANHRAFRAREWRGFRDTFYDFFPLALSLRLYGCKKLGCHPILMVKAMLRYRWMVSYLTAAHMVDRHTMGLRGKERYAHNQFFSVLHNSVLGVRDIIVGTRTCAPQQAGREAAGEYLRDV